MGNMSKIELERPDLGTLLGSLASRLRNYGLSLMGRAFMDSKPGDQDFKDADRLWASLEDTAAMLDAVKTRLCRTCRLIEVVDEVAIGKASEGKKSPIRRKR